jgi:hypothetical protein
MGISLLLHSQSSDRAVSFLNEAHSRLNSNISKREQSGSSYSIAAPNEAILRKLVGRGYSENGARRAALSTQGQGFDEALRWAVTYSLDPGFDGPMVILKETEALPEHGCFRQMSFKIDAALNVLSGKSLLLEPSTDSALPAEDAGSAHPQTAQRYLQVAIVQTRTAMTVPPKPTTPVPADTKADYDKSSSWEATDLVEANGFGKIDEVVESISKGNHLESTHHAPTSDINEGGLRVEKEKSLEPSLASGQSQQPHPRTEPPAHSIQNQEMSLESTGTVSRDLPNFATSQPPAKIVISSGTSAEIDRTSSRRWEPNRRLAAPGISITRPSDRPLSKLSPSSPQDPVERSELRKMGRAALDSVRTATSPGQDDRRRLIEEGRRLLQLSRLGPAGAPNVPPPLRKLNPPSPPRAATSERAEKTRITRVSFGPPSYHMPQQGATKTQESGMTAPNAGIPDPNAIPPIPKAPPRPPLTPSNAAKAPPPPPPPKSTTQESNGWDFDANVEDELKADSTDDAWGFGDEDELVSTEDLGEEEDGGWGFDDDI